MLHALGHGLFLAMTVALLLWMLQTAGCRQLTHTQVSEGPMETRCICTMPMPSSGIAGLRFLLRFLATLGRTRRLLATVWSVLIVKLVPSSLEYLCICKHQVSCAAV